MSREKRLWVVLLLALSVLVIATTIQRLTTGAPPVQGLPVLIVSAVAALVMLCGALILHSDLDDAEATDHDAGQDSNVRAVLLDTATSPRPGRLLSGASKNETSTSSRPYSRATAASLHPTRTHGYLDKLTAPGRPRR